VWGSETQDYYYYTIFEFNSFITVRGKSKVANYRQAQSIECKEKRKKQKYITINTSKKLIKMCMQSKAFIKGVSVPTDCTGSRNISCKGTGIKTRCREQVQGSC
jgi:hypothetical protein